MYSHHTNPRDVFEVLLVCTGNVCRSPLSEGLLKLRLRQRLGAEVTRFSVSSAGTRGLASAPMDRLAAAELARLGGEPSNFSSRRLDMTLVTQADLILTATREQRSTLLAEAPAALRKTFTLREFADLAPRVVRSVAGLHDLVRTCAYSRSAATLHDYDIADPIGQSPGFHRSVATLIDEDVSRIACALSSAAISEN